MYNVRGLPIRWKMLSCFDLHWLQIECRELPFSHNLSVICNIFPVNCLFICFAHFSIRLLIFCLLSLNNYLFTLIYIRNILQTCHLSFFYTNICHRLIFNFCVDELIFSLGLAPRVWNLLRKIFPMPEWWTNSLVFSSTTFVVLFFLVFYSLMYLQFIFYKRKTALSSHCCPTPRVQ